MNEENREEINSQQERVISLTQGNYIERVQGDYIFQVKIDSQTGGVVNINPPDNNTLFVPRNTPVFSLPRRFNLLLGRREEVRVTLDALAYDQDVEIYGSTGLGKSVFLRYLAHHPSISAPFADGIIYHLFVRHHTISDLLQFLFNAFYESNMSFKPKDIQLQQALKDKRGLIILDNSQLTRDEVSELLTYLPNCAFLFASHKRQLLGEGRSIKLNGLPLQDSISLVARELQRQLTPEERPEAEKLSTILEGNPLYILQAVALVREDNLSLKAVAHQLQSGNSSHNWTQQLLKPLSKRQKLILAVLAVFGGVALGAEQLAPIAEIPEVKPVLESLLQRNLIEVEDSRYKLTGTLLENLPHFWDLTPGFDKALAYFKNWIQQCQEVPEHLLQESDGILQLMDSAVKAGQWADVLYLGKALEGTLAISGQWGAWNQVLTWLLEAARTTSNQGMEAYALHQLGTRSLCLGETSLAQENLTQALKIREDVGDTVGAKVSSDNLKLLEPIPINDENIDEPGEIPLEPINKVKKFITVGSIVVGCIFVGTMVLPRVIGSIVGIFSNNDEITLPESPSNLSIEEIYQTEIDLSWEINNGDSTRLKVERSPDGSDGTFRVIKTLPAVQASYLDQGLEPDTTYYYRIRATNDIGDSEPSNTIRANTLTSDITKPPQPLQPPSNLSIEERYQTEIDLSWEINNGDSTGLKVERSTDGSDGTFRVIKTLPPVQAGYLDQGLEPDTTYYYRIRATNDTGDSDPSKTIRADTLKPTVDISLNQLSLEPASVTGGNSAQGEVVLNREAIDNGFIVELDSSDPELVEIPQMVTIPAGQTRQPFTINTYSVNETREVTITASPPNSDSPNLEKEQTLQVEPEPINLINFTLESDTVIGGEEIEGEVELDREATDDIAIELSSDNPDLAKLASLFPRITVPAEEKSQSFKIRTNKVDTSTPVTLTASYQDNQGIPQKITVEPEPVSLEKLILKPDSISFGETTQGIVGLNRPAPENGVEVALESNNSQIAPVPKFVIVQPRQTEASFDIKSQFPSQNSEFPLKTKQIQDFEIKKAQLCQDFISLVEIKAIYNNQVPKIAKLQLSGSTCAQ